MEHDGRIPGVTFHLDKAALGPSVEHKAQGKVILMADVDDFDMWEEALKHLGGMRVYSVDDFKSELIEMLQEDTKARDKEIGRLRVELNEQTQRLRLQNDLLMGEASRARSELKQREAQLAVMEEELASLRGMARDLESLGALAAKG